MNIFLPFVYNYICVNVYGQDLNALSAKELKEILKARSVDFSDCYEKCDLVNKVQQLVQ